MAIATMTTLTNAIREVYTPQKLIEVAFHNRTLFDFSTYPTAPEDEAAPGYGAIRGLFPVVPSKGGDSWNWPVVYSTGAAESYSEGQGAPAPGNNTVLMASVPYSGGYVQRTIEITGHVLDACRDEGEIFAAFEKELQQAASSLVDLINTTALGTSFLQLAVDSAGTYAGIDRATYSAWGSWENALNGALSKSALQDTVEALTDNDRGANPSDLLLLVPVNQLSNYAAIAGSAAGYPLVSAGGQPLDLGFSAFSYAGIPMIGVPDMLDTLVVAVHRPSVKFVMHRPLQIQPKPTNGDTYAWLLTACVVLVIERPHLCGKQTGVTA